MTTATKCDKVIPSMIASVMITMVYLILFPSGPRDCLHNMQHRPSRFRLVDEMRSCHLRHGVIQYQTYRCQPREGRRYFCTSIIDGLGSKLRHYCTSHLIIWYIGSLPRSLYPHLQRGMRIDDSEADTAKWGTDTASRAYQFRASDLSQQELV